MRSYIRQVRAWRRSCAARSHIADATAAVAEALERRVLLSYTVTNLDDSGAGSLRDAIAQANATAGVADVIDFQWGLTGTIVLATGELPITDGLEIQGPGTGIITVSGNNASRVFNIGAGVTATLSGLTVQSGRTLVNGWPANGGAIYNAGGTLAITRCTISNNRGDRGGAIYNAGTLHIADSTFDSNSGDRGGGVYNVGTVHITGSTFRNNSGDGGGLWNWGSGYICNSTFHGNYGYAGGAIENLSSLTVLNSTFSGNWASYGGGIYNFGSATLHNTIVAGNSSDLFGSSSFDSASSHNLIGIIDGSSGLSDAAPYNNIWGTAAAPLIPMLGPLADIGGPTQTMALLPGSQAIDAGANGLLPADTSDLDRDGDLVEPIPFDQRGGPRIVGGTVDIGAVEEIPLTPLVVSTVADELDGDYSAGDLSLREALAAARTWPGADTITFSLPAHSTILTGGSVLVIDSDVTLLGPGADQLTVDGQRLGPHTFLVTGDITVAMSGLRISGGGTGSGTSDWEDAGGGIANKGATLLVRDCTFTGNSTIRGGGLSNLNGTVEVVGSVFEFNGGAGAGGAIANYFGTLNVTQSTIRRNYTSYYAAAVWNYEGTLNMSNVAVSGNVGNTGSIHDVRGNTTLVNCTVVENSAAGWGGGGIENYQGTVELQNTIVARHGGMGDLEGDFDPASSHNLIGVIDDSSTGIVAGEDGNIGGTAASPLDPAFVRNPNFEDPVDYGDLHPRADSLAADGGNAALLPPDTFDLDDDGNTAEPLPVDLDGHPRIMDAAVDIGAFERRSGIVYLSDLIPTAVVNGWGAYEKDRSNGEAAPADGHTIKLNGQTYAKGLGVHAYSSLKYDLAGGGGGYTRFQSDVGVDDEVGNYGSVIFQVYLDNVLAWQSGTMSGSSATNQVDIPVAGKSTLELRVGNNGNGNFADHADWAGARLLSSSVPDTTPPTPNPSAWAVWPTAVGPNSIRMEAAAAADANGVQYYFEETSGNPGGSDSEWQDSPIFVDTGLTPGLTYTYWVRTCDKSANRNGTSWSTLGSATTTTPLPVLYLSDLKPVSAANGWGSYEKDRSNGESGPADGHRITLNGIGYDKGLGVHAGSVLSYSLGGLGKTRFAADIGLDDEVGSRGSVVFEVRLDGVLAWSSAKLTGASTTQSVELDITGKAMLELRVTGAGDGITADHADWANALLDDGAVIVPATTFLSDLVPAGQTNGWGTYEKDRSNGENRTGDGRTITLNGQAYAKGLGVHAESILTYSLIGRNATRFQSDIGIDDEVGNLGSVVFQVWLDGTKVYDSGRLTGATATKQIDLQIAGKSSLELRVTGAGDGTYADHADWAGARFSE